MDLKAEPMEGGHISGENKDYTADAIETVQLKFVNSIAGIADSQGYNIEFCHQHFGDSEMIIGYKGLEVTVSYAEASLFIHPSVNYIEKAPIDSTTSPDDIEYKLRDALPRTQLNALISDANEFQSKLEEQKTFLPPGELVQELKFNKESENAEKLNMRLYKVETIDADSNEFIERAQSIAMWYIETAGYTENYDPRFFHYLMFELLPDKHFRFAGYASCYKFYHYHRTNQEMERIRISHFLLSPVYRQCGNGVKFLNAVYNDLKKNASIFDITAETPAESFTFMRDYADCLNLSQLPEFSKQQLKQGYSREMEKVALKKHKISKNQSRRVYEILKMSAEGPTSQAFKTEVLMRLSRVMLRSNRDLKKFSAVLPEAQLSMVHLNQGDDAQKKQLEEQFQNCLEGYKVVIDRLRRHEPSFRTITAN